MLSINTNISSLIAQNSLKNSTLKLNQAVERMSTGYKINHAADNAANYSIATNMTTKIGAYQVAEDNCAMGLDMLTTASESLNLMSDKLIRLRALAEQAANGTYGEQSLKAINSEANTLVDEIERCYSNSDYNGIKLFNTNLSTIKKLADVNKNEMLSDGTYTISSAQELAQLAEMTNAGNIGENTEFILANDINLSAFSSGQGWTPIGNSSNPFKGSFDGNGHVISNLYINGSNQYLGLFGVTAANSEIKNIGLQDINIKGNTYIGGLVALSESNIVNCYVTGRINATDITSGGLVAESKGSISNCYTDITIRGLMNVGGLVGSNTGSIVNSYASGSVVCDMGNGGGLVGSSSGGNIENCYSTASVRDIGPIGGFIGSANNTTIRNSYCTGTVSGDSTFGAIDDFIGTSSNCNIDSSSRAISSSATRPFTYTPNSSGFLEDVEDKLQNNNTENEFEITLQVGIKSDEYSQISFKTEFNLNDITNFRNIGTSNNNYIEQIDRLINIVTAKQTEFGAVQNRLESALDEISTQYENLVSSRSTLKDADIAEVSSEYIRQQILQQASASLLSTANQSPALALQLL